MEIIKKDKPLYRFFSWISSARASPKAAPRSCKTFIKSVFITSHLNQYLPLVERFGCSFHLSQRTALTMPRVFFIQTVGNLTRQKHSFPPVGLRMRGGPFPSQTAALQTLCRLLITVCLVAIPASRWKVRSVFLNPGIHLRSRLAVTAWISCTEVGWSG